MYIYVIAIYMILGNLVVSLLLLLFYVLYSTPYLFPT